MEHKNKMLIDATHPEETRVVVLRNGRVEEFDYESAARKPLRGNIYLAKVTRVEPSLQAAFVDYGGNRHGFLAFSEIHPDYYQIPFADRQALLQEEADAEAEAEAEADARAEARSRREDRHRRGDHHHGDEAPDEDNGRQDAVLAGSYSDDDVLSSEPAPPEIIGNHEPEAAGGWDTNETAPEPHHQPEHSQGANGESHVEEIASDQSEAPEDVGASPEQMGADDALEEVPERPRRRMRSYKIQEVIKRRQIILVQVVKEERGSKGAALTTYLSLAGRYTVLMPNTGRGGGISRKITNAVDRKRLKAIAHELEVPDGMGLIVRTAGAARTKQELKRDFEYLLRLWENVRDMTLQSTAPCLVYEEGNLIKRSIRDLFTKDTDEILVAGEPAHKEAQDFMRMLSPSQAKSVIQFEDTEPLFARFNIERQLNAMFSPYVTLRSGGYLVINQTEALVSIDVNSGKSTREFSIEETALQTNLEASEELARQLKLRDLAGLIVIDFIDMEERRNNRKVENRLKDALRHDRARIQVGRISHFGLLEMSRQRLRTGVVEGSTSQCPHCQGTGIVRSTESVSLAVLRAIEDHLVRDARSSLTAVTTADVALYILNNKRSFVTDMERRHGVTITVEASARMHGANFAIEKSSAPVAPQKAAERPAAVNMAWGFEGQGQAQAASEEELFEEAAEDHPNTETEGDGRRPRRRRRRGRGRGEDRGEPRARGDQARSDANGESDDSQPSHAHDDQERGPDEGFAETPDDIPGVGEQPSTTASEDRGDDRRGRPRRRGRRGGRRGRDRDGARQTGEPGAHHGNGADRVHAEHGEHQDHTAGPDLPHEPVAEPSQEEVHDDARYQAPRHAPMRDEPAHAVREERGGDEPRWSEPVEAHRAANTETSREADAAPAPRAPERREPVHVEPPVEEDDPSRPVRKGWWQRRFTGA